MKLDRDKLIRAREMLGYGLETTAERAGVSKNSVLRAEHEEDIRPVTARKIAAALEVRVADLVGKAEAPEQPDTFVDTLLRAPSIPAEELSDEDLAEIRRVLAGGKPRARFVDEEEERDLERLTAEASELAASELPTLKPARERRGISLNELAARAGMPAEDIAALEQGAQKADAETVHRLAAVLDCFRAELLFPSEQVEAFLAENERQNELIREQAADMSGAQIRELVLRHPPLRRLVEAYRTAEHHGIRNETA